VRSFAEPICARANRVRKTVQDEARIARRVGVALRMAAADVSRGNTTSGYTASGTGPLSATSASTMRRADRKSLGERKGFLADPRGSQEAGRTLRAEGCAPRRRTADCEICRRHQRICRFSICYAASSVQVAFAESVIHECGRFVGGSYEVPAMELTERSAVPSAVIAERQLAGLPNSVARVSFQRVAQTDDAGSRPASRGSSWWPCPGNRRRHLQYSSQDFRNVQERSRS
jgi:hypothetical protein